MKYTIYCDTNTSPLYPRIAYSREYDTVTKLKRLITRLSKKWELVVAFQQGRRTPIYETITGYQLPNSL